jgi:hypothetical protein
MSFYQDAAKAKSDEGQEEAWAEYMAAGMPGEAHEGLARMAGDWTAETWWWTEPGAEPTPGRAVSTNKMVLGGRFLATHYESLDPEMPFQGVGMMGFNNTLEKYQSTWCDSMGTMIFVQEGTASDDGNVITMHGEHVDAVTGERVHMREVYTFEGATWTFEIFETRDGGDEAPMMKVVYTRA